MKDYAVIAGTCAAMAVLGAWTIQHEHRQWVTDRQVAAGEWAVEVQVPPCDGGKDWKFILPKPGTGGPLTIECTEMPVPEREGK